jgi:arabinofuranan 3-O-arabinosyltransferase
MTYAPQRPYSLLLPTGLAVSGSVLVAGLVVLLGLLLRRSSVPSTWARLAASRRGPRPVTWTVSVGATLVLLGPVVLAGLLVGASARQGGHPRRRLRPTLVGVTVALAVLVVGSAVVDVVPLGGASRESIADVLAALGLGLLVGIVLGSVSTAEGEGTVA